jgi:uncharacterized damage-inducible protein DinB
VSDPVAEVFVRQFGHENGRLRKAIEGLAAGDLDRVVAPQTNSVAVLVAHATGSELGWLHVAAGRSFQRDRDSEFRTRGVSAAELDARIERASRAMPELVAAAIEGGLGTKRATRSGDEVTAGYALVHALEHLAEHVGQIELTRQLITMPKS